MNIKLLLKQLTTNREYVNKVLPFIREDYFEEKVEKAIFRYIANFINEYNTLPTENVIEYEASKDTSLNEDDLKDLIRLWEDIQQEFSEDVTTGWLINITEEWCKERAIYLAVSESISIITDEKKSKGKGAIPDLLKDALSVSFDTNIGHDFSDDAEARFEYYHKKEKRLPFDIELLNKITKGGVTPGTLNILLGSTNSGKTLFLSNFAASYLQQGFNVLYITLEISEEEIAKRIDSNLMNIAMGDIYSLSREEYLKKIEKIRKKTIGKLIIKQYPTGAGNTILFRSLLNELHLKKNFVPDVILIDYLTICSSSRIRTSENSYSFYKSVAEEVRGLAVDLKIPIWSVIQTNRGAQGASDMELSDVAESHAISMTADFMLAIITTPEFIEEQKVMLKQLKSRYADPNYYNKIMIGMDRSKMKLYNLEDEIEKTVINTLGRTTFEKPKVEIDFS
ncbi:MAG: DnaB-like helicase C-terminal domain-containing protein [Candidatus Poseidoniales archaeon]